MWYAAKKAASTLLTSVVSVVLFVSVSACVQKRAENDCAANFAEWKRQAYGADAQEGTLRGKSLIIESEDGKRIIRLYAQGDEGMMTVETNRGAKTASLSSLAKRFGE